jgi:hypothetical protein
VQSPHTHSALKLVSHAANAVFLVFVNTATALQVLTAQLLFHKPENPLDFCVDLLATMREQGSKHLLDKSDVETMFGMFDITHQGLLNKQQAHRALSTVLGADHQLVQASARDAADTQTKLTKHHFVRYVTEALRNAAA